MAYKEIHGAANQLNNKIPKYIPYIQQESVYGQKYLIFIYFFTIWFAIFTIVIWLMYFSKNPVKICNHFTIVKLWDTC